MLGAGGSAGAAEVSGAGAAALPDGAGVSAAPDESGVSADPEDEVSPVPAGGVCVCVSAGPAEEVPDDAPGPLTVFSSVSTGSVSWG